LPWSLVPHPTARRVGKVAFESASRPYKWVLVDSITTWLKG